VQVEVHPARQVDDLRRDAGAGVVADLAEGGEVEVGEAVAALGAAEAQDDLAGAEHVGGFGGVAHQLEGQIGLDGAAQVGGAAGIHRPAALFDLEAAEVIGYWRQVGVVLLAEDELEEDELGFEDAVALELADPVAVGLLEIEQGLAGTRKGKVGGLLKRGAGRRQIQINGRDRLEDGAGQRRRGGGRGRDVACGGDHAHVLFDARRRGTRDQMTEKARRGDPRTAIRGVS
jgi:hypothetical protein